MIECIERFNTKLNRLRLFKSFEGEGPEQCHVYMVSTWPFK